MVTDNQSVPASRDGPPGWIPLALASGGWVLKYLRPVARDPEDRLVEGFVWAVGMTMVIVVYVASIRLGPVKGRGAAYVALGVCLPAIGIVMVMLAEVVLRGW